MQQPHKPHTSTPPDLYEQDFYAWTQEQAARLRAGKLAALDLEHLAVEIESMGISQRNELKNRLRVLLLHLLKWQFQPQERSSGWVGTIVEQRDRLELLLEDSPSLHSLLAEAAAYAYPKARRAASRETQLPLSSLPDACPYTLEQVLNDEFWPD
jgi:hypothetical protein